MLQIAERGNELEAKGPGAQAHDTVMRGVRSGNNAIGGFGAGLNQTDRLMDSIRGIQGMVPDITAQKARGGDDALLASGRALTLNAALTSEGVEVTKIVPCLRPMSPTKTRRLIA